MQLSPSIKACHVAILRRGTVAGHLAPSRAPCMSSYAANQVTPYLSVLSVSVHVSYGMYIPYLRRLLYSANIYTGGMHMSRFLFQYWKRTRRQPAPCWDPWSADKNVLSLINLGILVHQFTVLRRLVKNIPSYDKI